MKCKLGVYCILLLAPFLAASGQLRETYQGLLPNQVRSQRLPGPQHLRNYVSDGKLQLRLQDAILLTLENNSAIRIQQAQVETAKFALLGAYKPFDPQFQTVLTGRRNSYPGFSQIQGAGTFNDLNQSFQVTYTQTLQTGTNLQVGFNSTKDSCNSGFYFLNPYYQSFLNLQITQPLLRNRMGFEIRAPLIIARTNLQQSRASFEAQVNAALLQVITRYWELVSSRNNLEVAQKSQDAAEATYRHDKRALELGALPPLDIYRSEYEVASRRVQVIQAEYSVKRAEENLRLIIGADQDVSVQMLVIDPTEKPAPEGELLSIEAGTALQEAFAKRPEIRAWELAVKGDDTSIQLAHNQLRPDLQLQGFYQGSGVGGDSNIGQILTTGGLRTSVDQLFTFGYPGYGASLTLNLPIKNRSAQADLGSALVNRHRDLYSSQQAREQITLDVNNAVHQLEQAKLTLKAGKAAVDLAQKMLSAEQRKAELGAENIFLELDAQSRVALAEANLLQAQVDYQNAMASLNHATGTLLQQYQVQIAELTQ